MIAFALGSWAIAAYLRGRAAAALAILLLAFAVHPTTAMWFAIWAGVAIFVSERAWRVPLAVLAALGALLSAWAVMYGPLRGHLHRMDPLWASAMAGKDYIFPSDWNASFWLVNLSYLAVVVAIYALRRRRDVALPRESGLVAGGAALVALFLGVLAFHDCRRCACVAATDVARVLDPGFSCGDLSGVAVRRGASLVQSASRRCGARRRRRRRPRSFRVELGACRQPDRADRVSAG